MFLMNVCVCVCLFVLVVLCVCVCVCFFVSFIVEGNYNRLRASAASVPHPSFSFFVRVMLPTVRKEVCCCCCVVCFSF